MSTTQLQKSIDSVRWYHEFDFGNGLTARSPTTDVEHHRRHWAFIERNLDTISFQDKTVLDIGCWDGYWSFYAEKQGARSILAADDFSQNWAGSKGLYLAKELLGSSIEVNPSLSIYDVASLKRTFDIILVLGVYYHLWDPFYAFAQVRHCCHPGTIVVFEGNAATALPAYATYFSSSIGTSKFTPTAEALLEMLAGAYFRADSQATLESPLLRRRLGWCWRLRMCWQALKGTRPGITSLTDVVTPPPHSNKRVFVKCSPFEGQNEKHLYAPPFGLYVYDPRFHGLSRAG